jgi:chromosome segregation ATPase
MAEKAKDVDLKRISENLDKQLRLLQSRKDELGGTVREVEQMIGSMQGVEFKLRGEIHDLVNSENRLNEKRVKLRKQLSRVENEIEKLKQVFSELEVDSG